MHSEANDKHKEFILVVAWFFTLLGAYFFVKTLGQLTISFWTMSSVFPFSSYMFLLVIELIFSIAALAVGLGMLNRRAAALGNSVVFLWLYAAFQVAASTWSLIELLIRSAERAELPPGAPEILRESYNSGSAYAIYGIIGATLTIAVCVWLARRLSLPIIKAAYST